MRVGIIGGGISGLTAGYALSQAGHPVTLFERQSEPGGLASTCDLGGTRIERYYHFLCGGDTGYFELCQELGLANRLRFPRVRTGFYFNGVEYPFSSAWDLLRFSPVPLTQRIRFGLFALEARMREQEWRQLDELAAKPWLIDRIGLRAYEVIWEPLLSLKFGAFHAGISAAWVWHRLHRVARSKGRMGYLDGPAGSLLDALAQAIHARGGAIRTGCGVARIVTRERRVKGLVLADGAEVSCDAVISTLPLSQLAEMLPEDEQAYAAQLRQIRYIGVVCVLFKLARPVTRCFWLNVNDPRIPFNGIIEYTNMNPMAKDAGHIAYVPYYVATDHPLYCASDAAIVRQSWDALRLINPALRDEDILAHRVFRDPFAQAVCPTRFLDALPDAQAPIHGLHLLDSVYLYPEDRTQSGLILRARACAAKVQAAAAC